MQFGLIGNINKPEVVKTIENIIEYLDSRKISFAIEETLSKKIKNKKLKNSKNIFGINKLITTSDLIIAAGGDGTILSIANLVGNKQVPILGVNLGKLGFLTEASSSTILNFINEILNHNYKIESRTILEVKLKNKIYFGLNDVVIDKGSSSRIVKINSFINNSSLMDFIGDGIIVSTPTGSTGYSLATGGPIIAPTSEVFVISPICAHTLNARSLVIPDDCEIEINASAENEKIRLTIDGQQRVLIDKNFNVKIKKANYLVKLIKPKDSNYYDVLRKKLFWTYDARTKGNNK